ncbi:MAG: hypothetical protein HXY28_09340 [Hydrogenophilaceae bacterium]|nr:hypothetical protein [Hydrogenophilaceae bacterium]
MGTIYLFAAVFGGVLVAMGSVAWAQWLDHRRRMKALDVIKAALERGMEAPAPVYAELSKDAAKRPPWSEVIIFTALGVAFWVAYFRIGGDSADRYAVIATAFTVTALGCLVVALLPRGAGKARDDAP